MHKGRFSVGVLVVVVGVPVLGVLLWPGYRLHRYRSKFLTIARGTTRQLVIDRLGSPGTSEPCGDRLWWDDQDIGPNNGECVVQMRYWSSWSPENWVIGLDARGNVVSKSRELSP